MYRHTLGWFSDRSAPGRLFAELDRLGRTDDTMIVLTSDHGDYMGDHRLGEKDWLHDEVVRVPMIVVDPDRPLMSAWDVSCRWWRRSTWCRLRRCGR